MTFESPSLINFVRVKGMKNTLEIGALDESEFEKWLENYNKDLKNHYKIRRNQFIQENEV
jgi:hypothetical protein